MEKSELRDMKAALVLPEKFKKAVWDDAVTWAVSEITQLQFMMKEAKGTEWDEGAPSWKQSIYRRVNGKHNATATIMQRQGQGSGDNIATATVRGLISSSTTLLHPFDEVCLCPLSFVFISISPSFPTPAKLRTHSRLHPMPPAPPPMLY